MFLSCGTQRLLSNRVRELDPGIGGHMTLEELKKLTREDIDRMSEDETLEALVTLATKGDEVIVNKLTWLLGVGYHSPDAL